MGADARLNLLVTHEEPRKGAGVGEYQRWYQTLSQMLSPMGVQTFEATSGPQAVKLIEERPIHLAVVDTRLPDIGGMNVLKLIQKIRDRAERPDYLKSQGPEAAGGFRFEMKIEETDPATQKTRRIEVKFDGKAERVPVSPVVFLLTPQPTSQVMQEALKFNAFSVLAEPVDVNLMLEMMARAMKRFHQNQWPQ
jgi:DNA-binding NtrC family response regulator